MTAGRRVAALVALVATTALVAGVGAVAGAGVGAPGGSPADAPVDANAAVDAGSAAPRAAVAQANGTATFDTTIVTTERGDTVALTVVFEGTDRARLTLGDEVESNYVLNATVEDGNGDGRTVVLLDLELAGLEADPLSTASQADSVTVTHETVVGAPIEPSEYPLTLSVGGVDTGVATLIVEEQRTPPDGTTSTPGPQASLDLSVDRLSQGGTADVAVGFDDSDEMTLTISGSDDLTYNLVATLRDGNDDGQVALTFDAGSAGDADAVLTARDDADSVSVTIEESVDGSLPPGEYVIGLRSGPEATNPSRNAERLVVVSGTPVGTATVTPGGGTDSPDTSLPTQPAIVVLVGVAVGGLGVAVGSRLVTE